MNVRRNLVKPSTAAIISHKTQVTSTLNTEAAGFIFKWQKCLVKNLQAYKSEKSNFFWTTISEDTVSNPGDILIVLCTAPQGEHEHSAWKEQK